MRRLAIAPFAAALLALAASCEEPVPVTPPQPSLPPTASADAQTPPTDPAPVVDGDVTVAWAHGIKILVKRIPGADLASIQLYVRGGVRGWSAGNAGIERLALATAVHGGTKSLDKDAWARKLAALGSDIGSESRVDYASISAKMLRANWQETFGMLVSAFREPALPESELAVQRARQLSIIEREQESPDSQLSLLVHQTVYRGHPFEHRSIGTAESVGHVTLDAIREHLVELRKSSRLLLVAAGDLDAAEVAEKARAAFADLPAGALQEEPFPPLRFEKAVLAPFERKLETNYIQGVFPAPTLRDPDYADALVTMSLLRHRLFEEVRTKRNLSYAPGAGLGGSTSVPLGYLYVTAVDPNKTFEVMLAEAKRLQGERVSEKDLLGTKSTFLTQYLMQNESTDGQASMLAVAELLGHDYKLARTLPERIRAVTPEGVQAFAKKHLGRLRVIVLGDASKLNKAVFESL